MIAKMKVGDNDKVRFSVEGLSFSDMLDMLTALGVSINALERTDPRYARLTKRFDPMFQIMELALEHHRDKFPLETGAVEQATGAMSLFRYYQDLKKYNDARKTQTDKPK